MTTKASSIRKILHVDMDAFFTSVEQRDNPSLKGVPLVVGGDPISRGVVSGASYEARRFGVRSAMSCSKALKLCPKLIFVKPRFERYQEVSSQINSIFREVTPLVEPLSLDEAYLDVTENNLSMPLAREVAQYIKQQIFIRTGLTASAGVGPNKFIAKIASDLRKPDGLVVIPPEKVWTFLENLLVERMWGVGPATTKVLHEMGIKTAGDIRRRDIVDLESALGKFGTFLHRLSQGIDDRPVEPHWDPKSRGAETTFQTDVRDIYMLRSVLSNLSEVVANSLLEMERQAKTITLKIRYSDFTTLTRSKTLFKPTDSSRMVEKTALFLLNTLADTFAGRLPPVRLIGVSVNQLLKKDEPKQLWLDLDID